MLRLLSRVYYLSLFVLCSYMPFSIADTRIIESHGFALHGDLKYANNFEHFDYVNPEAPKGGTLRLMGYGSYDSLNPYILKGTSPFNSPGMFIYGFSELNETLLVGTGSYSPSGDEPQSAYGLLAETVRYPDDFSWVEFDLRPQAHFHDGHAIDANDVVFSYDTLVNKGHPRYQQTLSGVDNVSAKSKLTVRVTFKHNEQPANILRIGELPVLPEHYWRDIDFERSSHTKPLLSGPYRVASHKTGQSLSLARVDSAWFNKLPKGILNIYKGRYNFDEVIIDFYRDQTVAFEGFKADNFDMFYDYTAKNWAKAYDFPAIKQGSVIKAEIKHEIPSTTQAFFFNSRKSLFSDVKVREALSLMFDFEWTNKALFNGAYKRNVSYFPNSEFQASSLPSKGEIKLLEPLKDMLPPKLFTEAFSLAKSQGDGRIRAQQRQALKLLKEAGWGLHNGKMTNLETGKIFSFEILIRQAGIQRVLLPFIKNLQRIGIVAEARMVDTAQYKVRLDQFDYDMTTVSLSQGHAPSYEQRDYFHSDTVSIQGSQNYAGISDPAIDALLAHVVTAKTRIDLVNAMNALDRVLLWKHYSIPNWHLDYHRIAYWQRFGQPKNQAAFKLGTENWWKLKK